MDLIGSHSTSIMQVDNIIHLLTHEIIKQRIKIVFLSPVDELRRVWDAIWSLFHENSLDGCRDMTI